MLSAPGFDWHPHSGIETVTVVLAGALEHADSSGGSGVLHPGDVQWMTAGRGIAHREQAPRGARAHVLQLWLDLPPQARDVEPRYQDVPAAERPRLTRPGAVVDVVAGTVDGATGPARPASPVQAVLVTLDPDVALDLPVPAADRVFALVLGGAAVVSGRPVAARQTAWSEPLGDRPERSALPLRAGDAGARLLVVSARPLPSGEGSGAGELRGPPSAEGAPPGSARRRP